MGGGFPPQPGFPQQAAPYGYYPQPRAYAVGQPGKGMAITGIATGIVALVISVLFLAVVYTAVTSINTSVGVFGG
jgi:hypothetical protein